MKRCWACDRNSNMSPLCSIWKFYMFGSRAFIISWDLALSRSQEIIKTNLWHVTSYNQQQKHVTIVCLSSLLTNIFQTCYRSGTNDIYRKLITNQDKLLLVHKQNYRQHRLEMTAAETVALYQRHWSVERRKLLNCLLVVNLDRSFILFRPL